MAVGVAVAQAAAEEREEGVRKAAAEREKGILNTAAGREEIARLEEQLKAKEKDNEKEIAIALLQQELEHQKETSKIEKEALQREADTAKANYSGLVMRSSVKVRPTIPRIRPSMVSSDISIIF